VFGKEARMVGQTLALTTLVVMEMLKALGGVSVNESLVRVPSWKNKWLLAGVAVPMALHVGVVNGRGLGAVFGMVKLSRRQWGAVLAFAAPILAVDEVLKAVGRRVAREEDRGRRRRSKA
jgi:hypothetical protein